MLNITLETIIEKANVPIGQIFEHLLFTPIAPPKGYIKYKIEVICSACDFPLTKDLANANPSPPEDAK
jgi:hypothetical protein